MKAIILKDVDSLSLVFSKGESEFENFTLSVSPTRRVCVSVCLMGGGGGGGGGGGVVCLTLWIVYMFVCFYSIPKIRQYSIPVLTLRRRGELEDSASLTLSVKFSNSDLLLSNPSQNDFL